MKYQIVGKNVEITVAMKKIIKEKLNSLKKFFLVSDNVDCRVVVSVHKIGQKIEVTIPTKVVTLRAEVTNENLYNGVDEAVARLEQQLRKAKSKMSRKNKESFGTVLAMDAIKEAKEKEENAIPVKTKRISVEPMDLDKAIGSMTLLGHDFFIYKDADINKVAVVYKRKNGGYGLIEVDE